MTKEDLKLLISLKNMAHDVLFDGADEIYIKLDELEFNVTGAEAKGIAKGIALACKCFELNDK